MTRKYSLKIDEKKAFERISKAAARQQTIWELYTDVLEAIADKHGKNITKRIETTVKKALPKWNVSLSVTYSPSLALWQNSPEQSPTWQDYDYQNQITLYLPSHRNADGITWSLDTVALKKIVDNFWENDTTNTVTALNMGTSARWDYMTDIAAWNEAAETLERLKAKHENDQYPANYIFDWN